MKESGPILLEPSIYSESKQTEIGLWLKYIGVIEVINENARGHGVL